MGGMMQTQNGECSAEFCSKRFAQSVSNGGGLSFVFDFLPAQCGFGELKYVVDAGLIPTLKPGLADAEFQACHSLKRRFTFQPAPGKRSDTYQHDWWRDVY